MFSHYSKIGLIVFLLQFLFATWLLSSTLYAASDPDQEDIQQLDPVIVSATKTPVPVSHITSSVEVMTEKDFQQRKIKTVLEGLQFGQGLAVFQNGGPGGNATVRMRGGTSSQTLVLLDGAIMNSATLGEFNFGDLTTDNIARIEILRGAQSMVWGSDAIGGVINITTKRGKGNPKVNAFFEYGSFVTLREGGQLSGSQGPVDFSFALSRWDTAGFSAVNFRRGALERDRFGNWQGSSLLGLELPHDGRVQFNFRWLNSDRDIDSAFTTSAFDTFKAKGTSNRYVFSGTYSQPITDWWEQILTLSRQNEDSISQFGTARRNVVTGAVSPVTTSPSMIDTISNRIEWQSNFQLAQPVLLTLGYQFREQLGKNEGNFGTTIVSSHAGFALFQLDLWDRVFATAGVRHDAYNRFGDATTYRVTGGYLLKETGTKIHSSYGTGFRVPTINELVFPGFGNPNAQPEKSQSFDIGIDQSLFDGRVNLHATYFWNRYRNLLTNVISNLAICGPDPFFPSFAGSCVRNLGLARAQGGEFGVDIILLQDWTYMKSLTFHGQYTLTYTRELEGLNPGSRLTRWPVNQASGILRVQPVDPLSVNFEVRFVGDRFSRNGNRNPLDSFVVFNLAATYDVNKHVQVYTRVENLFDEKYEEVQFFGTTVRSIWGGLRVNFEIPVLSRSSSND